MPVFPRFPVHCGSLNMFNKVWPFANGSARNCAAKLWQRSRNPPPIFSGLYMGHSAVADDCWWLLCPNSISSSDQLNYMICYPAWPKNTVIYSSLTYLQYHRTITEWLRMEGILNYPCSIPLSVNTVANY